MVNEITETNYWADLITKRLAASPREQIEISESAIRAGLYSIMRVKLNLRDQEVCLDDEIACIALIEEYLMPMVRFTMDNGLDFSFGPSGRSEEDVKSKLDEHFRINEPDRGGEDL